MDCTFCQLGVTPCTVSERGDYVPMQDVLAELDRWKNADGQADHITLSGSGEPTLHSHFGDVFRWAKNQAAIPSVLLTNGSLLHMPAVRTEAALADKVKVTMSAWNEASFQKIHRPAQGITFDLLVKGERAFREEFGGELSVEVFIIDGVNSQDYNAARIAEIVHSINPDRIDINTAVRPAAVEGITASSEEDLNALAKLFGEKASVTAAFQKQGSASVEINDDALLGLIKRHPSTCAQLAGEFNLPEVKMLEQLRQLVSSNLMHTDTKGSETYYFLREN